MQNLYNFFHLFFASDSPLVFVAASAIFWNVSKKDPKTEIVVLKKRRKKETFRENHLHFWHIFNYFQLFPSSFLPQSPVKFCRFRDEFFKVGNSDLKRKITINNCANNNKYPINLCLVQYLYIDHAPKSHVFHIFIIMFHCRRTITTTAKKRIFFYLEWALPIFMNGLAVTFFSLIAWIFLHNSPTKRKKRSPLFSACSTV